MKKSKTDVIINALMVTLILLVVLAMLLTVVQFWEDGKVEEPEQVNIKIEMKHINGSCN